MGSTTAHFFLLRKARTSGRPRDRSTVLVDGGLDAMADGE
jgi:hypothetical protein